MKIIIYMLLGVGAYSSIWGLEYHTKKAQAEERLRLMPSAVDPSPILSKTCSHKGMKTLAVPFGEDTWKVTCLAPTS